MRGTPGQAATVDFQKAGLDGSLIHGFVCGSVLRRWGGGVATVAAGQVVLDPGVIIGDLLRQIGRRRGGRGGERCSKWCGKVRGWWRGGRAGLRGRWRVVVLRRRRMQEVLEGRADPRQIGAQMVDQTIERGAVSCVRGALAGLVLAIHYDSRRRARCWLASGRRLLALKRAGFYTNGAAGEGLYRQRTPGVWTDAAASAPFSAPRMEGAA